MSKRKFNNEFKGEAVKLVREQGMKVAVAARDLGISATTLHNWLRRDRAGMLDPASPERREHEELKRLRKENACLKQEKEILVKATAFFAKLKA
jgi:transposase